MTQPVIADDMSFHSSFVLSILLHFHRYIDLENLQTRGFLSLSNIWTKMVTGEQKKDLSAEIGASKLDASLVTRQQKASAQ